MPEFTAPRLGNTANLVTIDANIPANAHGVLYALGAFSGGLVLYVQDGILSYEYNLFEIERTRISAKEKLPTGTVKVNGKTVAQGTVPLTAPLLFTANDCLDIGTDLGSPVSLEYYEKAPFTFTGKIEKVHVQYLH